MPDELPRREDLLGSLLGAVRPSQPAPIIINAAPGATVIIYTQSLVSPESPPPAAKSA